MLDEIVIQFMSLVLSTSDPQLAEHLELREEINIARTDWTGAFPIGDWSPATGETVIVEDHFRELAHGVARFSEALSSFGVDPDLDRIAEEFMRRTATAVTKRKLVRK